MATLSKGYSFGATEQVTAAKLHSLVDSASITSIATADISNNAVTNDKIYSVDGSKLTGLGSISSGAGTVPDTNLPAMVKTTGDQTVAGIKTFSSFPVTPSSAPTTDYQVANKKYVDNNMQQIVTSATSAVATGNTAIPNDDTIPQISEGTEFLTCAITPTLATNKLKIDVVAFASPASAADMTYALFQDSTAGALTAGRTTSYAGDAQIMPIVLSHIMDAGTTSETTFRLRIGTEGGVTITLNGQSGSRRLGGICFSRMTITEYAP